jgi:TDG/mug DNA glycosylase family protein
VAGVTHFRTTLEWRGEACETLADILAPGLTCVFVGLNPSPVSVAAGHYMRGTLGRQFWAMLDRYGILRLPDDGRLPDEVLIENGFGFTDLAKCPSARAISLTREDIEAGREELREKVATYRPRILCSVYKSTIETLMGKRYPHQYGLLPDRFGGTMLFAAPFPYKPVEMRDRYFGELRAMIEEVRGAAEAGKPRLPERVGAHA